MTVHQTSVCFVCSHLASGQKEGDELRRNSDVAEILKGTQFPRICKNPSRRVPERIIDHEYVEYKNSMCMCVSVNLTTASLSLYALKPPSLINIGSEIQNFQPCDLARGCAEL